MKRSIGSTFLLFVLLTILAISGCAPLQATVPPTITAPPKPMSTATPLPSATPPSTPTNVPTTTPDIEPPFGSQYTTLEFMGKKFELRFSATDQPIKIYEYFLSDESLSDWIELVDIQINPIIPDGNKPIDFAQRTADAFIQNYPNMQYRILADDNSDAAIVHFFYPTSTREGYLEFDAYKFFTDPSSSQVVTFHYAKNIEDFGPSRSFDDVLAEIKITIIEVELAMSKFNLFDK